MFTSSLDLDNITVPTSIEGLRIVIPKHIPAQLICVPRTNKDLPNYVPVAICGFYIYARATYTQKVKLKIIVSQNDYYCRHMLVHSSQRMAHLLHPPTLFIFSQHQMLFSLHVSYWMLCSRRALTSLPSLCTV